MEKEVKYIGFYDIPDAKGSRVSTLAAVNKMDYIADAINQAGYKVHIVSPSWSSNKKKKATMQKGGTIKYNLNKKVTFCPTFYTSNKVIGYIKIVYSLLWLFLWLLKNTKRDEKIIVYHVQWLSLPIRLAKKVKGFHLILEVEEFYHKIWNSKSILNKWEQNIINKADSYIAVSDVLAKILGHKVKAVVYGNYLQLPNCNGKHYFDNNKINVVYAGSIDDTKGGAFNAVKCAHYLNENYIVHISGPGSHESNYKLRQLIDTVNEKLGREACVYHGVLNENDFNIFLQSCEIALNPQVGGDKFKYLFPSKNIKYLAANLRVISTPIESIINSNVGDIIFFSKDDSPVNIAEAIMTIDMSIPYNSVSVIQKLNDQFVLDMKNLLTIN